MSVIRKITVYAIFLAIIILLLLPPVAAAGQGEKTNLSINLRYSSYLDGVIPGTDNVAYLEVNNFGETDIHNITFEANLFEAAPLAGWEMTFDPEKLDLLTAGSINMVKVNIVPDEAAPQKDYTILITADADEVQAMTYAHISIHSDNSLWIWIGIGIGLAVIIIFIIIYLKSSKN
jgi:uncharacterized membrane protein